MIKALQLRINLHQEGKPDGLLNKAAYDLNIEPSQISGCAKLSFLGIFTGDEVLDSTPIILASAV